MRMPLVIEEDVGTQDRQNTPLVHSAEEKSLVNRMSHLRNVVTTRSWAGAERAVTIAIFI